VATLKRRRASLVATAPAVSLTTWVRMLRSSVYSVLPKVLLSQRVRTVVPAVVSGMVL
jgi:hypothetical protein